MTRYIPTGRPLSDREREILVNLAEEANEVAQAALKLVRFGFEHKTGRPESNQDALALEMGDFHHCRDLALHHGIVTTSMILKGIARKRDRLGTYLLSAPHDGKEAHAGGWLPEENPFPMARQEERQQWFIDYRSADGEKVK